MTIVNNYLVMVSKGVAAVLLVSTFFASCTKEKSTVLPVKIEGTWEGKFGYGPDQKEYLYALHIRPGGILERMDSSGNVTGSGVWEMSDKIFSGIYNTNGSIFSLLAAFDDRQGKLMGNWGYGNNASNGGTWEMVKKRLKQVR